MKIIVAPDSFKGSLSARQAAQAMMEGVRRVFPDAEIVPIPLADGGEGTVDALIYATNGRMLTASVTGPLGAPVQAAYGFLGGGATAVVEMAAAAGLLLVPLPQRDPRRATTYGVGELLLAALDEGAEKIIIGLGGSATNDGGAGAMQALGVRFFDDAGALLPAKTSGAALARLARVDVGGLCFPIDRVSVVIASDVTAPLLGPSGASAVFGPQKGADAASVAELEGALARYAAVIRHDLGIDVAGRAGAGAAGGLGAGLMAFLGAEMRSGIDLVLDATGFSERLAGADLLLTGEGRIDAQTLQGKTIYGVLARCRQYGVPVIAFGGSVEEAALPLLAEAGLGAAHAITPEAMPRSEAMRQAYPLLVQAVVQAVSKMFLPKT